MRTNRLLLTALNGVALVAVSASLLGCNASSAPTAAAAAPSQAPSLRPAAASSSSAAGAASPSTAMTSAPSAGPTPRPIPLGDSTPGFPLEAGARYTTATPFPVGLSFVAPAAWVGNIGGPNAVWTGPAATGDDLSFQLNPKVFVDPCHPDNGTIAGSAQTLTAPELVQALVSRPGIAKATPTPTTLGGRPATSFTLSLGGSSICDGRYLLWELPLGATNVLQPGMSERIWIVDVDGQVLTVEADDTGGASARQQIQQALDSLQFAGG